MSATEKIPADPSHPECLRLLGLNAAHIGMLIFFYGIPLFFFILSLTLLQTGIGTIRTGYFPPLGSVVFTDTIARKGTISTLRGVLLLAIPVLAILFAYISNNAYIAITDGRNMNQVVAVLEKECQ